MIQTIRSSLTLSSGSWSWKTGERPVILPLRFVYVCCGVLSPGAEISQYSAILLASLGNRSTELKLTWMFLHTISSKTLPAPIYHYFSNPSAWQSRARTLVHPIAGDLSIILEWLLTESIDDSKYCLYMVKGTSVSCKKSKYIIPRWPRRGFLTSFKRTR